MSEDLDFTEAELAELEEEEPTVIDAEFELPPPTLYDPKPLDQPLPGGRNESGQFQKGASAATGRQPKAKTVLEIKRTQYSRQELEDAIYRAATPTKVMAVMNAIYRLATSKTTPPQQKLSAMQTYLDRVAGKPVKQIELSSESKSQNVNFDVKSLQCLSTDELTAYIALQEKVVQAAQVKQLTQES